MTYMILNAKNIAKELYESATKWTNKKITFDGWDCYSDHLVINAASPEQATKIAHEIQREHDQKHSTNFPSDDVIFCPNYSTCIYLVEPNKEPVLVSF